MNDPKPLDDESPAEIRGGDRPADYLPDPDFADRLTKSLIGDKEGPFAIEGDEEPDHG